MFLWKFMPQIEATKVGGINTTAAIEKISMMVFWSMLAMPSIASNRTMF